MTHIKTIFEGNLTKDTKDTKGTKNNTDAEAMGCGECQTSCQSACKTSCTVANQHCEQSA